VNSGAPERDFHPPNIADFHPPIIADFHPPIIADFHPPIIAAKRSNEFHFIL
jgi:hypothetical protein